jgi:hypothetical protein
MIERRRERNRTRVEKVRKRMQRLEWTVIVNKDDRG